MKQNKIQSSIKIFSFKKKKKTLLNFKYIEGGINKYFNMNAIE